MVVERSKEDITNNKERLKQWEMASTEENSGKVKDDESLKDYSILAALTREE